MTSTNRPIKNHYDVLRVSPDVGQREIAEAFEKIREAFGPKSMAVYSLVEEEERRNIMDEIDLAYHVLSDPQARADYDKLLKKELLEQTAEETVTESTIGDDTITVTVDLEETVDATANDMEAEQEPPTDAEVDQADEQAEKRETERAEPKMEPKTEATNPAEQVAEKAPESNQEGADWDNGEDAPTKVDREKPAAKLQFDPNSFKQFDGAVLKKIREALEISLEEISEKTKIGKTFLNFIEDNNYSFLPATVYVRGFVKQLAVLYGINPDRVAESYMGLMNENIEE